MTESELIKSRLAAIEAKQAEERRQAEQQARDDYRAYWAEAEALLLSRNAAVNAINESFDLQVIELDKKYGMPVAIVPADDLLLREVLGVRDGFSG